MRHLDLVKWMSRRTQTAKKVRPTVLNVNPLELRTVPASLSGSVFVDANNNGQRDCCEVGVPGVTVSLKGKTDCGQDVCKTVVTDCHGNYTFSGLPGGWYAVNETQPCGLKDGKDTVGTAGGNVDKDAFCGVHLNNCTNATGYNFGEKNGSHGKGSGGKGSGGKCDANGSKGKGSNSKGSGGKGSHDRCDSNGSKGKGSNNKGSGGKGSHDRCDANGSKGKGSNSK
ncbi:MAG TPA: SdrD B-like domain-containing protein, partial [Gemmataceae bacterium]|nr:SdrD B-like domain-containing protein [Gemmataceae bacterium]